MKARISKSVVERIQPGDRDVICWDTEISGFGCKVSPAGRRSYFFRYRVGGGAAGRIRKPTIGRHGNITADEARAIAKQWAAAVARGEDPAEQRRESRDAPTLSAFAERYLREHAEVRKKPLSVKSDRTNLRKHILPALGRLKVPDITRQDIIRLHTAMKDTPGAANRCLALLSKMMNLAEAWGVRPDQSNPCRHVEKYREQRIERTLSAEELGRLAKALRESRDLEHPSALAAVRLLLFTGCRRNEILELKWTDVDLERRMITIPDGKTGRRDVPLNRAALGVLESLSESIGGEYVLPGRDGGRHFNGIEKAWRRIRDRAALSDVRLHDLRHSFASMGVSLGMGLPIVGKLLGHRTSSTTERYAHLEDDPVRAASERVGEEIAEAIAKEEEKLSGMGGKSDARDDRERGEGVGSTDRSTKNRNREASRQVGKRHR